MQAYIETHDPEIVYFQDGAPCHRSRYTLANLEARNIHTVRFPPYSPDLNIIEHVWNWMKAWIQQYYYTAHYDAQKINREHLRGVIWEAWNAVPNEYIQTLYDSWWNRCQAVIDAQGGPTRF